MGSPPEVKGNKLERVLFGQGVVAAFPCLNVLGNGGHGRVVHVRQLLGEYFNLAGGRGEGVIRGVFNLFLESDITPVGIYPMDSIFLENIIFRDGALLQLISQDFFLGPVLKFGEPELGSQFLGYLEL